MKPSVESARPTFFDFTARRPVGIAVVAVAACMFGWLGLRRLPVNLLPDVSYPTVTVRTQYPGASPRDVEERVSERVQELVAVVPGVRRVYSVSRPGVSDVVLEFAWGTQMVFAVADVRERLDRYFGPDGAEKPIVLRYDPALDPVLTLGLVAAADGIGPIELRRYAEDTLKPELAKVAGVAAVRVRGGEEEEITVAVDEQALSSLGLDIATLGQRLAAENLNSPSGAVEENKTELLVRAYNEYRSIDDVARTVIADRDGSPIELREVAKVTRGSADPEVIARIAGKPCVLVDLHKDADANVVDLCAAVHTAVFGTKAQQAAVAAGEHEAPLPPETAADGRKRQQLLARQRDLKDFLAYGMGQDGIGVTRLADQSVFVQKSIDEVLQNALQGALLAVLVIVPFLRSILSMLVLAVSIPLSLLATFAPMLLSGIDLNIMSLGGLALGTGMVIDNSIVVLESITKQREAGASKIAAAVQGTSRVASAVVTSTLTTVAVFFPIVFVEGIGGQLFRDQALTVVYSMVMSLLAALFVVPMLVTVLPERTGARGAPAAPGSIGRTFRGLDAAYPRLVGAALRRPWTVVGLAVALFVTALFGVPRLGQETLPVVHQGEFTVHAALPRSATVQATDETMSRLERKVASLSDVAATFVASGVDPEELNDSEEGKHSARLQVRLHPARERAPQEDAVRAEVVRLAANEPSIQGVPEFTTPNVLRFDAQIAVEVLGHDLDLLAVGAERVVAALRAIPSLRDVSSSLQRGNPELTVRFDRELLAARGLDAGTTARVLRTKVHGEVTTRFSEREHKIDIRIRADRKVLDSETALARVNVDPRGTADVPLSSVAEVRRREGPSEIRRFGNLRGCEVRASVHGFDVGRTQELVQGALAELDLPNGVQARIGGQKEEMERSNASLQLALWLAVFLVYVVMAAQFESLLQPFVIMVSVPFALIGVVAALLVTDTDVSVVVFLGLIVLAGIVVNNAIVMLDQINQLRAAGVPLQQAVVRGAHDRLRPVLMTTLTTLLGVMPQTGWFGDWPLLGSDPDGLELRAPMAITVISGLSASTLLTLVVVPVVYSLVERRRERSASARASRTPDAPPAAVEPVEAGR